MLVLSFFLLAAFMSACKGVRKSAVSDLPVTTIFLVRHAEKVKDGRKDPALTPAGVARAERLSKHLASTNIQQVYTTDYQRTRSTALPTAEHFKVELKIYNPRDTAFYQQLLTKHAGQSILVVGHSNTIPSLTNRLIGQQKYDQLKESAYGKLFLVTKSGQKAHSIVLNY